jgi:hypothetical protein
MSQSAVDTAFNSGERSDRSDAITLSDEIETPEDTFPVCAQCKQTFDDPGHALALVINNLKRLRYSSAFGLL